MYNKRGGGIRGGVYSLVASGMDKDIVEHPDFAGLAVALKACGMGKDKLQIKEKISGPTIFPIWSK